MNHQQIQRLEKEWWENNKFDVRSLWGRYTVGFSPHMPEGTIDHVADVGCGPIPFFCTYDIWATHRVAIDPLFEEYSYIDFYSQFRDDGGEIEWHRKVEDVKSNQFDVVFALNMLDHVELPGEMVVHLIRLLKPGGRLFLFVDIDKPPDQMHPHSIKEQWVRQALSPLETVMVKIEKSWKFPNYVMWYVGDKHG